MLYLQEALHLLYQLVFLKYVLMFLISLLFLHGLFKEVYERRLCNEAFLSRLDPQQLMVHRMFYKIKELLSQVKLLLILYEKNFPRLFPNFQFFILQNYLQFIFYLYYLSIIHFAIFDLFFNRLIILALVIKDKMIHNLYIDIHEHI